MKSRQSGISSTARLHFKDAQHKCLEASTSRKWYIVWYGTCLQGPLEFSGVLRHANHDPPENAHQICITVDSRDKAAAMTRLKQVVTVLRSNLLLPSRRTFTMVAISEPVKKIR